MRIVVLLLTALLVSAQSPGRLQPGYDSIQAHRLRADLTFLSSDALEGRLSLARGSEVAIQWIASEFAAAGLRPAAGDSYLQPVPLIEYAPDREATTLMVRQGQQVNTWGAPDATSSFPNEVSVHGRAVFAGFGISAPELNYDDYQGIDARGKIVLIFNHEPQENDVNSIFNGKGNTRYTNNYSKVLNAERHGAIAVLTTADPSHPAADAGDSAGRAGRGNSAAIGGRGEGAGRGAPGDNSGRGGRGGPTGRGGRGQQTPIRPQALSEGGAGIPLFTVSAKVAGELFRAAGKDPAAVLNGIDSRLHPGSFDIPDTDVELHTVVAERRRGVSYNVAGLVEGSDPALKAETIVFSGHFDHNGTGPAGVFHGADDNGSGTIGVVELARAYAMNPIKPRRSLLFIVFAAEERGLLGSYYYVAHPLRPLETTRAQLNFDMIGRNEAPANPNAPQPDISADTSNELGLIGTHYSPDYREVVERHNKTTALKLNYKWDRDAAQSILFRSDQYPFLLRNVPAVWWFTGFHPDYHQVTDTVERINFEKMTRILKLAYLAGFEFADGRNPPRFEPRAKSRSQE